MLAKGLYTIFGFFFKVDDASLAKILFAAVNQYVGYIAGNSFVNKQHKVVGFANAFALFGNVDYLNVLKYLFRFAFVASAHSEGAKVIISDCSGEFAADGI